MSASKNAMQRLVSRVSVLPQPLQGWFLSFLFGSIVPFTRTAGLCFEDVSCTRLAVSIRNRRKVQNHIKGVHASAMGLLAETASGFVVAMNLPDDQFMLLKSMKIDYLRRSQGHMRAVATLSPTEMAVIACQEKGEINVNVVVNDESEQAPIQCEMIWAWRPKRQKKN